MRFLTRRRKLAALVVAIGLATGAGLISQPSSHPAIAIHFHMMVTLADGTVVYLDTGV